MTLLISLLPFAFPLVCGLFVVAAVRLLIGDLRSLPEDPSQENDVEKMRPLSPLPHRVLHSPDA